MSEKERDPKISNRKLDHINLAFKSAVAQSNIDKRFLYEPMLSPHPDSDADLSISIAGKILRTPLWVSSMTGGTEKAKHINQNLAKICNEFGLGMGLGSCRQLLFGNERLHEFDVKELIGDQPLYANLGIAQLEQMIETNTVDKIHEMVHSLKADGIFIHVNPLQEWMQPEGDQINVAPIESISAFLKDCSYPVIVKEVGQGMGKESLRALLKLPLAAIELAGNGGTNFSRLELLRSDPLRMEVFEKVAALGHGCKQMILWVNELKAELKTEVKCERIIASGGIKDFLDGYYLTSLCDIPCLYAQASGFLKYALEDYETLYKYVSYQVEGYKMASSFLKLNSAK